MRIQVAVGVLVKGSTLLIQQRQNGTACAGQWEFPGGKLEKQESAQMALQRELHEELGIIISKPEFLCQLKHDYEHAKVCLHTFMIHQWHGEAKGVEGQQITWVSTEQAQQYDLLQAAYPLLERVVARLR